MEKEFTKYVYLYIKNICRNKQICYLLIFLVFNKYLQKTLIIYS